MTDPNRPTRNDSGIDTRFDRRRVLQVLGAGARTAAITGLSGAKSVGPTKIDGVARTDENASGDEIHPVFGFSALAPNVQPPEEPDHEVRMLIAEREAAPIPAFFFEPTGLYVEPGDTVKFNMATPHHNVVAYHPGFGFVRRVPNGVPPFSGPLLPISGYWLYTFNHEGVYEMNCAPHECFGMAMRIVVGDVSGPAAEPLPDLCAPPSERSDSESEGEGEAEDEGPELRTPEFAAYTVLTDPALDPERIVGHGSVSWEAIDRGSKRLFVRPSGFHSCRPSGSAIGEQGNLVSAIDRYGHYA
jgi:plastocyanin